MKFISRANIYISINITRNAAYAKSIGILPEFPLNITGWCLKYVPYPKTFSVLRKIIFLAEIICCVDYGMSIVMTFNDFKIIFKFFVKINVARNVFAISSVLAGGSDPSVTGTISI